MLNENFIPGAKGWVVLPLMFVCCLCGLYAQKTWTGGRSGQWNNPLNWQPLGAPSISDDVILDNSFQGNNYTVTLPDNPVSIHSLLINPASGDSIQLLLPASNTSSPALSVYDSSHAITIKKGGVLKNSSGINSGQSIWMNGLLFNYNGGRYIHNSRSAHAADIVAKLSSTAGTEKGVFEFDVPGGSYPISLSNRTFGTLMLSSAASGGTQTYNVIGTSPVNINGDFILNAGVQFIIDLTRDMTIYGNYIQTGGVFNLASQNNNNVIKIKGDVTQDAYGIITETAGGLPVIELAGTSPQQVAIEGKIVNSVTLRINNTNGISLLKNLALPFKLELVNGKMKTSTMNLITVLDNCSVQGGSGNSFIEGPIKKIGNQDFEFPIGKQNDYAPLKISGTGGGIADEFVAEYFLSDPRTDYGILFENPPMVRISALEYWKLDRNAGSSSRKVSVAVGTYSQATALEHLVVAKWDPANLMWKNEGNSFYAGIGTGTITSNEINAFGVFTLGSTVATQNPLPLNLIDFHAEIASESVDLIWQCVDGIAGDIEVERSTDRIQYFTIGRMNQQAGISTYDFKYFDKNKNDAFFRLKITEGKGRIFYSQAIEVSHKDNCFTIHRIFPAVVRSSLSLVLNTCVMENIQVVITDISGRALRRFSKGLQAGANQVELDLNSLPNGIYAVHIFNSRIDQKSLLFFKQE